MKSNIFDRTQNDTSIKLSTSKLITPSINSKRHQNVPDTLIKIREKQLRQYEEEALQMESQIKLFSKLNKERYDKDKCSRVKQIRLDTHRKYHETDLRKRPSDRKLNLRDYTPLDNNAWKFEELRKWYNKGHDASEEDKFNINQNETTTMNAYSLRLKNSPW